ncbi:unnamed protein product [Cuscuta epithymum]|uniref:Uncharacterized protein n=1 Tax=Cuscuta epithymum TaxID=186058 RepID=A0AAV0FW29_9ASTE|nr:unnamed protein product [Cuscuta epithymum]
MAAVTLSQYLLPIISVMIVGHLGELYLSSTSIAVSIAGVTGFSFMVTGHEYQREKGKLQNINRGRNSIEDWSKLFEAWRKVLEDF